MFDISNIARAQVSGNLELLARQVVEGFIIGLHKSPFHGFSVEFSEHRLHFKILTAKLSGIFLDEQY